MTTIKKNGTARTYESPRAKVVALKESGLICTSPSEGGTQSYTYGDTDDWFNN